jgi:hypothetical protein
MRAIYRPVNDPYTSDRQAEAWSYEFGDGAPGLPQSHCHDATEFRSRRYQYAEDRVTEEAIRDQIAEIAAVNVVLGLK